MAYRLEFQKKENDYTYYRCIDRNSASDGFMVRKKGKYWEHIDGVIETWITPLSQSVCLQLESILRQYKLERIYNENSK